MYLIDPLSLFMNIGGTRYTNNNEPITAGSLFLDTSNNMYAECEEIVGYNILAKCDCGKCSYEDRLHSIDNCVKLIPVRPQCN
jgi:hypothetical protein